MDNPNHKGNVAELAIAKEAAQLGLSVLKPLTEHERYDLALGIGGRLLRVQCKWGAYREGMISVNIRTCSHSPTRGYVVTTYDRSEVDAIAVYCGYLNRSYFVPISIAAGRGTLNLRLTPARNNQQAALNWAADYEFHGAVAQLEERVAGSDEVRGSSPLSSTSRPALKDQVGMDEFYAKLAHYVRKAEAGDDVLVTRWGKPVAQLGPLLKAPASSADD